MRTPAGLLSTSLWLVASLLALVCIFALRELAVWGAAFLFAGVNALSQAQTAGMINLASDCAAILLGVAALGGIIVSGDYAGKHAGETRLLRRLVSIIVLEGAIILPTWFVFWR